jgi:hypothetical protein
MALNQLFDEQPDPGSEMDESFAAFDERGDGRIGALAGPIFGILFGQGIVGPGGVIPAVVADLAQPVVELDVDTIGFGHLTGRLAGPAHAAGIQGVDVGHVFGQPAAEGGGLFLAQVGQPFVGIAAGPFGQVDVALAMANYVQVHRSVILQIKPPRYRRPRHSES